MDTTLNEASTSTQSHTRSSISEWRLIASISACYTLGLMSSAIMPLFIFGYMGGWGLSEETAGYIAGYELMALAMVLLVTAPFAKYLHPGRSTVISGVVLAGLYLVTPIASSVEQLTVLRVASGIVSGFIFLMANSLVSRLLNPDRIIGYAFAINTLALVLIQFLAGVLQAGDPQSFFTANGILALLVLPLLWLLPKLPITDHGHEVKSISLKPLLKYLLLLIPALLVGMIAEYGLWSFSAVIATDKLSMSIEHYGYLAGATSIAALIGNTLFAWNSGRYKITMLIGSYSALGIFGYLVMSAANTSAFQTHMLLHNLALGLFMPAITALLASMDHEGRLTNWGNTLLIIAGALAPIVMGPILTEQGYDATAQIILFMILLSALLCYPVARKAANME